MRSIKNILLCLCIVLFGFQNLLAETPEASEAGPEPVTLEDERGNKRFISPIEPLDSWYVVEGKEGQEAVRPHSPKKATTQDKSLIESYSLGLPSQKPVVIEDLRIKNKKEEEDPQALPKEKSLKLNSKNYARFLRAKKYRKSLIRDQQKELGLFSFLEDERGEGEVRVCSLNVDSLGIKSEVQRRAYFNYKTFDRKVKSFVSVISNSSCDIIGVFGIVGGDFGLANQGMQYLVGKLEAAMPRQWQGFIEASNHELAYQGIIFASDKVSLLTHEFWGDTILPSFEGFKASKFPHGPMVSRFKVTNKETFKTKELFILSEYFQTAIRREQRDSLQSMMQYAEGLRQLAEMNSEYDENKIVLVLVDRRVPEVSSVNQILNGRLRLTDFKAEGPCALGENESFECKEEEKRPTFLFSVVGNVPQPGLKKTKKKGGKTSYEEFPVLAEDVKHYHEDKKTRESDIFMLKEGLGYALEHPEIKNKFNSGVSPFKYGAKESPLVWAQLNW